MKWKGELYALPQEDGSHVVCLTLPPGVHKDGSFLVFRGEGPELLVSVPGTEKVADLKEWLAAREKEGFRFTPTTMRELYGDPNQAR